MKKIGLFVLSLAALALSSCNNNSGPVTPAGTGFYIVNEGWFNHTQGSFNRIVFDADAMVLSTLVPTIGNTTCYGVSFRAKYYFISKQGQRVIVSDGATLKKVDSLAEIGGDGRAFAGIDAYNGVVTTSQGAFKLGLSPLKAGEVIAGTAGNECGGVYSRGEYIYIINKDKGLQIFNVANKYTFEKSVENVNVGFALSREGDLWCAGESFLVRIDRNNNIEKVDLPAGVKIYSSWGSWNTGSLRSSSKKDVLYFAKYDSEWGGGNAIYEFDTQTRAVKTFATSKDKTDSFYGGAIFCHPVTGNLWATFVGGYDYNDNRLVEFDGVNGKEIARHTYSGYWFPAMMTI